MIKVKLSNNNISDPYNDPLTAHYTAAQKYTRQHLHDNSSSDDDDDDDVVTRTNEVLYDVIGKESGNRKKDHKSESNRQKERWLVAGSDDRKEYPDESPGGRTKMNFYHSEWNSTEPQRAGYDFCDFYLIERNYNNNDVNNCY